MSIQYLPDGTITVPIEGVTYRLRCPYLDELFELWGAIDEITRAEQADTASLNAAALASAEAATSDDPNVVAAGGGASTTELQLRMLKVNAGWMERAFMLLASPVPTGSWRRPSWFASANVAREMLAHWQQVPLDPGSPATQTPTQAVPA